jgi:hypothetical protein
MIWRMSSQVDIIDTCHRGVGVGRLGGGGLKEKKERGTTRFPTEKHMVLSVFTVECYKRKVHRTIH